MNASAAILCKRCLRGLDLGHATKVAVERGVSYMSHIPQLQPAEGGAACRPAAAFHPREVPLRSPECERQARVVVQRWTALDSSHLVCRLRDRTFVARGLYGPPCTMRPTLSPAISAPTRPSIARKAARSSSSDDQTGGMIPPFIALANCAMSAALKVRTHAEVRCM